MKFIKSVLFVLLSSLSIVGAIVGVGFVSGKEIVSFFFRFQPNSIWVALIAAVLLFLTLLVSLTRKIKSNTIPNKNRKNNVLSVKNALKVDIGKEKSCSDYNYEKNIFDEITGGLCLLVTATMLGGVNSLLIKIGANHFWLRQIFMIILIIFIGVIIIKSSKYLYIVSGVMTFLLCSVMIVTVVVGLSYNDINNTPVTIDTNISNFVFGGVFSSIFYVSMNMLSCSGILTSISRKITNKFQTILIALIASGLLFLLIFLLITVFRGYGDIVQFEMPMLELAKVGGDGLFTVYLCMLFSGCLVALVSVAYSGKEYIFSSIKSSAGWVYGVVFMSAAYIISLIGFEFLIEKAYPFIGMVYLLMGFCKFILHYKNRKK